MGSGSKIIVFLLSVCPLFVCPQSAYSDLKKGQHYRIELVHGENVSGFFIEHDGAYIVLESRPSLHRRSYRISDIATIERANLRASSEVDALGDNPHANLYFTASSALPFQAEALRTTAHWLIADDLEYAFSENWALHASSITFYPYALGLRCSFSINDLNYLGGGIRGMAWLGDSDSRSDLFGFYSQARFTHGTSNRNFTVGAGIISLNAEMLGAVNPDRLLLQVPVLNAAFCNRFAAKWSLVLEGYVLPEHGLMAGGGGFKFLKSHTIAWAFGCYSFASDGTNNLLPATKLFSIPLPYISYSRTLE